ncbi:hypothetical protein LNP24_02995 [Klebsiella pneumoniae subsp. pneumoniae]|nr:hypothetical protein [Klebsiella pneumoniae subsp. pneumoniae]
MSARVVEALKARAPVAAPAQLATSGAVNDIPHQPIYQRSAPDGDPVGQSENHRPQFRKRCAPYRNRDLGDSGLRYQPGDALGVCVPEAILSW